MMENTEILTRLIELSNSTTDFNERLQHILQFLAQGFKVDDCFLYIYHPEEETLSLNLTNHGNPFNDEKVRLGEGIVVLSARNREPVFTNDLTPAPVFSEKKPGGSSSKGCSIAAFPITDSTS